MSGGYDCSGHGEALSPAPERRRNGSGTLGGVGAGVQALDDGADGVEGEVLLPAAPEELALL